MANYYGQYPDIYSADDTRYTYFYDDGERVTLVAGENGMTREWIHVLKMEHRGEYNMMRRGAGVGRSGAHHNESVMLSLDRCLDDAGYEGEAFLDEASDAEANYIAKLEARERRERIRKALASLTPKQRELLIRVRIRGESAVEVARAFGIDKSAISRRMKRIEKKLMKSLL